MSSSAVMRKSTVATLALAWVTLTACGSDSQATIYQAEESQMPSTGRKFESVTNLIPEAEQLLGYACAPHDGTDIYGMEYTTCDPDPSDTNAGVRLSVGLDAAAAEEAAASYWALNRGMDYTVIQDGNWVVSGPTNDVLLVFKGLPGAPTTD